LQYPTDLVLLVVLWRCGTSCASATSPGCFSRGFVFSHEAVRDWEARFAPLVAARLHAKRRGRAGARRHADETYRRVNGRWCYLHRAIDREGSLVEALLNEKRDMDAAQRFFAQAPDLAGHAPAQVTTDGPAAYPRAIRETLGPEVERRASRCRNNRIEQDHRGIKQRHYPHPRFGSFVAAARFCPAVEEQRQYFRVVAKSGKRISLAERRRRFRERWVTVMAELAAD
jgi:putative transposase